MYYLGIDGGGTKTVGILANTNGDLIRTHHTGPGNVAVLREKRTKVLLAELVAALLDGEPVERIHGATLGFAGARGRFEKTFLQRILTELGIPRFTVLTDADLLHFSVLRGAPGLVLASGTGSICVGKDRHGRVIKCGGWGYLLGDDGSGYHLGQLAIRSALQEVDSGARGSHLSQDLLAFFDVRDAGEVISKIHASDNPQFTIASCARLVCEHAERGVPNAVAHVDTVAAALCSLIQIALDRLDLATPITTGLAGSLLNKTSIVLSRFKTLTEKNGLPLEYCHAQMHPAAAAVLHAVAGSGATPNVSLEKKLKEVHVD